MKKSLLKAQVNSLLWIEIFIKLLVPWAGVLTSSENHVLGGCSGEVVTDEIDNCNELESNLLLAVSSPFKTVLER